MKINFNAALVQFCRILFASGDQINEANVVASVETLAAVRWITSPDTVVEADAVDAEGIDDADDKEEDVDVEDEIIEGCCDDDAEDIKGVENGKDDDWLIKWLRWWSSWFK